MRSGNRHPDFSKECVVGMGILTLAKCAEIGIPTLVRRLLSRNWHPDFSRVFEGRMVGIGIPTLVRCA